MYKMENIAETKTDIDGEQVLGELRQGKFDIGDNSYTVMTSISRYVNSIYDAVNSLQDSWASVVSSVGEYIDVFKNIPEPDYDPTADATYLDGDSCGASLKGVNSYLNVRTGAGINNSVAGTIASGTAFTVITAESKKDDNGTLWYKVKYKDENGKEVEGWASSQYISVNGESLDSTASESAQVQKPASEASQNQATPQTSEGTKQSGSTSTQTDSEKTAIVDIKNTNSSLNVRQEPGGAVIDSLKRGEVITILNDDGKSPYVAIKRADGKTAYVARQYISVPDKKSTIAKVKLQNPNSHLNVRTSGSNVDNTNIVDSLPNNASVEVISKENGWAKIKLNGVLRYVSTDYLDM